MPSVSDGAVDEHPPFLFTPISASCARAASRTFERVAMPLYNYGSFYASSAPSRESRRPEESGGRLGVVGVDLFAAPEGAGAGSRTAGRRVFDRAELCGVLWTLVDRASYGRDAAEPRSKL